MGTRFLVLRRAAVMGATAYMILLAGNLVVRSGDAQGEVEAAPSAIARIEPPALTLRGAYN